jgi:hypothetical protein
MKSKILKLCPVVLLFLILGASCQKDEFEYADESIEIYNSPGIAVYKTRSDYINYIAVRIDTLNKISPIPGYTKNDPRVLITKDGKATFSSRWRLKSGYIVTNEMYINYSFSNISIGEYIDVISDNNGSNIWTGDMIMPRIIDKDPFLSFYYLDGINQPEKKFTLGEINKMIEDETLEAVFNKLK